MVDPGRPVFKLPTSSYDVGESRVFTHPTRLADVYTPDCLAIVKPAFRVTLPPNPVRLVRTRSSALERSRRLTRQRRAFMQVLPAVQVHTHYLLDLRYEADKNISHVVTFALPLALLARSRLDRPLAVVLRANSSSLSQQVFRAFGIPVFMYDRDVEGTFVVGSDGHDRVYEPYYPELFGRMSGLERPEAVAWDRIYVARRGTRSVANDEEVHAMLAARGFRRCYFEDYPVATQWAITRAAKVVVGVHGAALSSLTFASPGVKVVELFNPGYSVDFFRRITELAEGRWCGVFGRIPRDFERRVEERGELRAYHYAPLHVSPTAIERALEWLDVR